MSFKPFILLLFIGSCYISVTDSTIISPECNTIVDEFTYNSTWFLAGWANSSDQYSKVEELLKDSVIIEQHFWMRCNEVIKAPYFIFCKINHRAPFGLWTEVIDDHFNF